MAGKKEERQKASIMGKLFKFVIFLMVIAGGVVAAGNWWINNPLTHSKPVTEFEVVQGASARTVVNALVDAGVEVQPELLYQYFRWSGKSHLIRAGTYEINSADSPYTILEKLVQGIQVTVSITLPEGWTFAQIRARLNAYPDIKHDTLHMTDAQIMEALGRSGEHPEGRFFPDTYSFSKGISDLQILRLALTKMDAVLAEIWAERDENLPINTPYEALVLASIIEKETGVDGERFMVAGVFTNRLRRGMLLQTDPTVVYGVGDAFTGRLTRRNLDTDTPYNTYTRAGLTPTPIAMPSRKSLLAAVHPANTRALFFVARGDGSSHFSDTNADHNRAVDHYIRGRTRTLPPSSGIIEP